MKSAEEADLLLGATAITAFINELIAPAKVSKHVIYRWVEAKHLPAGKIGLQLIGSRRLIRERFERLAAGADP